VDIHFVCSFCLFSVTILQYLISLLQCTQTDRHTDRQLLVMMMMVATERKRVGGTETKFYQSLISSYVTGECFLTNCQQYLALSFSTVFTCLTAKTSCIVRLVANHDDTHPLFFSPSLSIFSYIPAMR